MTLLVFAGTVYGSQENPKITFNKPVNLRAGVNKISLLSIAVGLPVCSLWSYGFFIWFYIHMNACVLWLFIWFYRTSVHILKHGTRVFLVQSYSMVSIKEKETWHGKNGHTRFVFYKLSTVGPILILESYKRGPHSHHHFTL